MVAVRRGIARSFFVKLGMGLLAKSGSESRPTIELKQGILANPTTRCRVVT